MRFKSSVTNISEPAQIAEKTTVETPIGTTFPTALTVNFELMKNTVFGIGRMKESAYVDLVGVTAEWQSALHFTRVVP